MAAVAAGSDALAASVAGSMPRPAGWARASTTSKDGRIAETPQDAPCALTLARRAETGKRDGIRMNMKRMRGRNHRPGGGSGGGGSPIRHHSGGIPLNRNHVFDSNGPDLRIRGTAQQLFEKYLQLGRDATSSGDRVMAEGYFQHAEHYFRILNAMNQAAQQGQQQNGQAPRRSFANGEESQGGFNGEGGEEDGRAPGTGDQPDARDIPIAAAPPEG